MSKTDTVTAAMLVIGDEILSGRTRDSNAHHLANIMTAIGIDLKEIRVVSDNREAIVSAINALRKSYTYVFTSGGIGPTHDDITAESIADAFGLPCDVDSRAKSILADHYASRDLEFTPARLRMARMPEGASLIDNPISKAPGFVIGNVHVMAGVPSVFEAMLDNVVPTLRTGTKLLSTNIHCPFGEGTIGAPLSDIQTANPDTIIGSYPRYENGSFWTEIVIRARARETLDTAAAAVNALMETLRQAERTKI